MEIRLATYKNYPIMMLLLSCIAFLCFIISLIFGDTPITHLAQLSDPNIISIVKDYRLPAALVGICAAINFSLAGILLQVITKNNLTTPNIIGMNTGASLFAVVSLLYFTQSTIISTNLFAFFGAIFACFLYILLSKNDFKTNVINGLALDSIFVSLTSILLLIFPNETGSISLWLAGSLWGKNYNDLTLLLPSCISGIIICLIFAQKLNILGMTDDQANSLGVRVNKNKALFLFLSCFLSGTAVACTGPIGFISLFIPNISKIIVGDNLKKVLPFSILLSIIVITLSDTLSRTLIAPDNIPVGVIVSIICSPYLIFLIRKT